MWGFSIKHVPCPRGWMIYVPDYFYRKLRGLGIYFSPKIFTTEIRNWRRRCHISSDSTSDAMRHKVVRATRGFMHDTSKIDTKQLWGADETCALNSKQFLDDLASSSSTSWEHGISSSWNDEFWTRRRWFVSFRLPRVYGDWCSYSLLIVSERSLLTN